MTKNVRCMYHACLIFLPGSVVRAISLFLGVKAWQRVSMTVTIPSITAVCSFIVFGLDRLSRENIAVDGVSSKLVWTPVDNISAQSLYWNFE